MKIKRIISQHWRNFWADYECEHCGYVDYSGSGYDDANFHESVIPAMKCPKCGKTADASYRPLTTKYPEGLFQGIGGEIFLLKACPFCGKTPKIHYESKRVWKNSRDGFVSWYGVTIECTNEECGVKLNTKPLISANANGDVPIEVSEASAAAQWNRRA